MKRFDSNIPALYHEGKLLAGQSVRLEADEAQHLRALRLRPGDPVLLLDGRGGRGQAIVMEAERGQARLMIEGMAFDEGERAPYIVLALGMLSDRGRFEWMIEKGVELGAAEIIPLTSERSEGHFNAGRARRIAIAALKQSQRLYLPTLHEPLPFRSLLDRLGRYDLPLVCHESAPPEDSLASLLRRSVAGESILLMIGPEGGFSDAEVDSAREANARVVSLGPARLRAETAAIAALAVVVATYPFP